MFLLTQTADGHCTYALRLPNGEILFTSPEYSTRLLALKAIDTVRLVCARDVNYQRATAANGNAYFVLRDADQGILGTSRSHATEALREADIALSQLHAPRASVQLA